jgi:hypothetical protein
VRRAILVVLAVSACGGDGRGDGGDGNPIDSGDAGSGSLCRVFATAWTVEQVGGSLLEGRASWDADASTYRWQKGITEGSRVYDSAEAFVAEGQSLGLVTARSSSESDTVIFYDSTYLYDEEGRLVRIETMKKDLWSEQWITTYSVHDELGRRVEGITDRTPMSDPDWPGDVPPPCHGIRKTFAYDDEARRVTVTSYGAFYPGTEEPCADPGVGVADYDSNFMAIDDGIEVEQTGSVCVDPPS